MRLACSRFHPCTLTGRERKLPTPTRWIDARCSISSRRIVALSNAKNTLKAPIDTKGFPPPCQTWRRFPCPPGRVRGLLRPRP